MTEQTELVSKGDLDPAIERLSHEVIGAAIEVHRELGPGLLEGIYEDAMEIELKSRGLVVVRQVVIPIFYRGTRLRNQKLDMLVENVLIIENKSVSALTSIDRAQLLSYLRAGQLPLGLLFNFNVEQLRNGMHRVFNERAVSVRIPSKPISTSSPSCLSSSSSR